MRTKRIFATLVLLIFFITTYGTVYAAPIDVPIPAPPTQLSIPKNGQSTEPSIGYDSADGGKSGYYADIQWQVVNPADKYVNIYLQESPKGYRTARPNYLKEKDLPAGITPVRMRDLTSGTVYTASSKAYATELDPLTGQVYSSGESESS